MLIDTWESLNEPNLELKIMNNIYFDTEETVVLRQEVNRLKRILSDRDQLGEVGQWEFDLITREAFWSEEIPNLFDLAEGALPPQSFDEFLFYVHPEDLYIVKQNWEELKNHGMVTRQCRIITCSGRVKHIHSVIKSELHGGEMFKVYGVDQDVTAIVNYELNSKLDQLGHDLFKGEQLTWMGGYEIDCKTREVIFSRNLLRIVERELGEQLRTMADFLNLCVSPDDKERCAQVMGSIIAQTTEAEQYRIAPDEYHVEFKIITARSQQIKYLISRFVILRENAYPVKIQGLTVDATPTKIYETNLIKSREQFKLLFDNMTQGVSFHDQMGRISKVNAAALRIIGIPESEYVGKRITDFDFRYLNEDGTEMVPGLLTSMVVSGKAITTVFGMLSPGVEHVKWLRASFIPMRSPLLDDAFFVLFEDISESRRSLELLHETNTQLSGSLKEVTKKNKTIEEASKKLKKARKELGSALRQLELKTETLNQLALSLISDWNGNIMEVNDRFLEVLGYERREVIGTPDFLSPNNVFHSGVHSAESLKLIRDQIVRGHSWSGELCKRSKSGKLIWLLETIIPLKNESGDIERFYFFNSEITQLKNREELITQEKRIAEQTSRIKEGFLSMMSHEIRTPLNSVIGLINLLQRRNPREDQMEIVQALKNSSDNLLYLVNSILDYNKLQAGNITQEQIQFNLTDSLRNISISSGMIAQDNGIYWELQVDPTVPEMVQGDMARVNQIMNNLIHNAIKFTPQGSIRMHVALQARVADVAYILFEISDTGVGISPEKLEKIFTPFYQANANGYPNPTGTGLGLSIVKELVKLLEGSITVQSELGKGSTFCVELPLHLPQPADPHLLAKEPSADIVIRLKGCKVLYVEDVHSNRFIVENLLSDMSVDITTARSGEEALLLTDKFKYDVILMDLQLPGMNGYLTVDAVRSQVRSKNRNTPVIAFTAKSYSEELKQKLLAHRIDDIIVKPFHPEALLEKIVQVGRKSEVKDEARENIISFSFYEIALRNNKGKLAAVKNELLSDLRSLEDKMAGTCTAQVLNELHTLIHRLRPVLKNLKCESLWEMMNCYQRDIVCSTELTELNHKTMPEVLAVRKAIQELPY